LFSKVSYETHIGLIIFLYAFTPMSYGKQVEFYNHARFMHYPEQ